MARQGNVVRKLREIPRGAAGFVCAVAVQLTLRERLRVLWGRPIRVRIYSRSWPTRTSELFGVHRLLQDCASYALVDPIVRRREEADAEAAPPMAQAIP